MSKFTTSTPDDHFLSPKTKNHSFDINSRQQNTPEKQSARSFTFSRLLEIKNLLQNLLLQPKIISKPFLHRQKQVVKGIFATFAGWCKSPNCNKEIAMQSKMIQILFPLFFTKSQCPCQKCGEALFWSYSQSSWLLQSELSSAFGWHTQARKTLSQ